MKIVLSTSVLLAMALLPPRVARAGGQSPLLRSSSPSSPDEILNERLAVPAKKAEVNHHHRPRRLADCPGEETFSFTFTEPCTYSSLRDELNNIKDTSTCTASGDDILLSLLGTDNQTLAETELVPDLCVAAYAATSETFPFSEITRKGAQFDNEYYSGGSYWNYEIETDDGRNVLKDDAARVKRIYEDQAQGKVINLPNDLPAFDPEGDGCELDAAFCCWVQDRQAGDNNGNCNTPYESQCIDQDPGDNTNFCYTDHSRSAAASHTAGGFSVFGDIPNEKENIEGSVHCHGFAWGRRGDDVSNVYKGNNLFFISMYDHLHQRGYARNAPGSAMCGCAENMAVVTRADCTEIEVTEKFQFDYNATTSALSGVLLEVKDVNFNACDGDPDNNDLESYYRRLVTEGRQAPENLAELQKILVGTADGNCNAAIVEFLQSKGITRPPAAATMEEGAVPIAESDSPEDAGAAAPEAAEESEPEIVEPIDIAYEGASRGGRGEAMPDVPTDLASLGEDDASSVAPPPPTDPPVAEEAAAVTAPTAPLEEEEPLKAAGEECEHGWDCMSGKCLGSGKCAEIQRAGGPAGGMGGAGGTAGGAMCAQEGEPCRNSRECCDGGCGGEPKACGAAA